MRIFFERGGQTTVGQPRVEHRLRRHGREGQDEARGRLSDEPPRHEVAVRDSAQATGLKVRTGKAVASDGAKRLHCVVDYRADNNAQLQRGGVMPQTNAMNTVYSEADDAAINALN